MQTQELGQSGRLNAMTAYLDHVIASSQKDDGPIATPPAKIACAIAAPLGAVGLEALLACGFGLCVAQCHRQAFDNQLSFRDRKSVVEGKSVSVRVDLGGCRIIKKKKTQAKI